MTPEQKTAILQAYFDSRKDSGRFSSQDVCDNLSDIASFTPDEVTEFLLSAGWQLVRKDDSLVWYDLS